MYTRDSVNPCPDWATALLNGFSQVLLLRNPLCGLCCLLAILFSAPQLVGGALLGAFAGLLTAQGRGYPRSDRQAGLYGYNGVLIGLLMSAALPWTVILPAAILAAGGLSSLLTHHWRRRGGARLTVYTAPFVLLGWATLAIAPLAPGLEAEGGSLHGVLRGLAQVFVLDTPLAGALIALGLLIAHPYAGLWALLGSALGGGAALLAGHGEAAAMGLYGFNSALAALAFSRQGERPHKTLLAILLALLVQALFARAALPALTAPFVIACWLMHLGEYLTPLGRRRSAPRLHG